MPKLNEDGTQPQDENRAAHDAKRGQKMMKLAELSRELPSEGDLQTYTAILASEASDRSASIMAAALVEQALWVAICARLADPGPAIKKAWFEGDAAPFGTFSAKIHLGRALGIYGEKMETKLAIIKNIRNTFAHRSTPIDFTNVTIAKESRRLKIIRGTQESARLVYLATCLAVARLLIADAFDKGGQEMVISYP